MGSSTVGIFKLFEIPTTNRWMPSGPSVRHLNFFLLTPNPEPLDVVVPMFAVMKTTSPPSALLQIQPLTAVHKQILVWLRIVLPPCISASTPTLRWAMRVDFHLEGVDDAPPQQVG